MKSLSKKSIILMSLTMMLAVIMPITVIAKEPESTQITGVNVTLEAPKVGDKIEAKGGSEDNFPKVSSDVEGLSVVAYWVNGLGELSKDLFYGEFEEDKYYYASIGFLLTNGLTLADTFPDGIKVNGVKPDEIFEIEDEIYTRCVVKIKAEEISPLERIAKIFNNSNSVKQYKEAGYELSAYASDEQPNELLISITNPKGETSVVTFELDGSVLSYTHLVNEHLRAAMILIDSVGQANGYNEGDLNYTLASKEISKYTLENEGIEIKENGSYYSLKIDIEKKIPLVDLSNFYLKPEDFDHISDMIERETFGNQSGVRMNLAYDVILSEAQNSIYIAEEDKLTNSAYNSILSAIEVMYGEKVVEYFKEIYPEIENGGFQNDGVTIETEFDVEEESSLFYNKPRISVVFNNQYIKERVLRTEYIGETVDCGKKTITFDFSSNEKYDVNLFSAAQTSDEAFVLQNILLQVIEDGNFNITEEDTMYCGFKDGKIVPSNKENSILKLFFDKENFKMSITATKPDVEQTKLVAKYDDVESLTYKEGATSVDMYRYEIYDVTLNIIYGKGTYSVLEGANQTFDASKNEGLTFRLDIEYPKFKKSGKVYLDGNLVDSSKYTSKEGSTIITFNDEYSKALSDGKHNLKVAVSDGEVSTTFTKVTRPSDYRKNPDTGIVNINNIRIISVEQYLR